MSSLTTPQAAPVAKRPWYRYGMVWLVLGGPLSVVVACIITWFVIAQSPNQVINTMADQENHALTKEGAHLSPAQRARNHAQTGGAPVDD